MVKQRRCDHQLIRAAVRADSDSLKAQQHRAELPAFVTAQKETFMTATAPPSHLPGGK